MNKLPTTPEEHKLWVAEIAKHEASLREQVSGLVPELQLDCLLTAYVQAAIKSGQLNFCANALIEVGGRLLFQQLGLHPAATFSTPAPGQPLQHPMPPTVQ